MTTRTRGWSLFRCPRARRSRTGCTSTWHLMTGTQRLSVSPGSERPGWMSARGLTSLGWSWPTLKATNSACSAPVRGASSRLGGEAQPLLANRCQLIERDAHLLHAVPIADGCCPILQGLEVDGYRQRGPDLILAAVAPAQGLSVVVIGRELGTELVLDLTGQLHQLRL